MRIKQRSEKRDKDMLLNRASTVNFEFVLGMLATKNQ